MGITLEQYRESIRKFCSKCLSFLLHLSFCCYDVIFIVKPLLKLNMDNLVNLLCNIFLVIFLLLVLAGDIETNPRPNTDQDEFCNISICHINIRSLKPKLNDILYKMEMIRHETAPKYNIITLSENPDDFDDFAIDGFQRPFIRNRVSLGGGVLCWVADNIAVQRRADLEVNEIEVMWLEIRENVHKFLMCVAHRPPSCADFWIHLQGCLDNIYITGDGNQKILLIGDFKSEFNTQQGQHMSNFATVNNFSTLIHQPTRITSTTSSVLDQCLTNFPDSVKDSSVEPPFAEMIIVLFMLNSIFKPKKKNKMLYQNHVGFQQS